MEKRVRIKDYKKDRHIMTIALGGVGLGLRYEDVDLLMLIQEALERRGGKLTINETTEIQFNWKDKWDVYFEKLETNKNQNNE